MSTTRKGLGGDRPQVSQRVSRQVWVAGLIGGLATACGIALTATSGWLIVRASQAPVVLTLMTAIVGVRAFGIGRPVLRYAERLRSHDAALADLAETRTATFARLIPLTPARLGRRGRGELLGGVVDDLTDVAEAAVRVTVPIVSILVAAVLALALTTWALPAVGLVVAGMIGTGAVLVVLATRLEEAGQGAVLAARAETTQVATLVADQATELRAVGGERAALGWIEAAHGRLCEAADSQSRGRALIAGGLLALTGLGTVSAAFLVLPTDLHPGVKALLVLTPVALGDAAVGLTEIARAHARARASAGRIESLLDQEPAVRDGGEGRLRTTSPKGAERPPHLRLAGVRASWTDGATHLGPIDLDLPPGSRVAITGPNGSGKSTLLAVLARHLDPLAGSVTLDGVDVRDRPLADVRDRIAIVDDEPHLFAGTLRANLLLAAADGRADDADIEDALRAAGLGPWLANLPDGLDTRLGAGGNGLSGGERARLAVARATLSRRPVILLDEPVAHLDHPTAKAVLADLMTASAGKTVIMVTHHGVGLDLFDTTIELAAPVASPARTPAATTRN
ncbi:thiol reductant ABC exporter subunit CydC [Janibacter sp. G56]|uniref:thiol reductant ABC exporter subunit CydC n=1 Tax=Janibacter sp. G56 TaxID=3418717 RepID=UPI003D05680E